MNQKKKLRPSRKVRRLKMRQARNTRAAGERIEELKAELERKDKIIADLKEQLHPMYGVINAGAKPAADENRQPAKSPILQAFRNQQAPDLMQATVAFDFSKVLLLVSNYGELGAEAATEKFVEEVIPIVKDMIFTRLMNQFCPTTLTSFRLGSKSPISTVIDRKVIWDAFVRQLQREGILGSYENVKVEIEIAGGKISKIQRVNYTVDGDLKRDDQTMYAQARRPYDVAKSLELAEQLAPQVNYKAISSMMDRAAIARSVVGPHSPIDRIVASGQSWGDKIAAADAAAKKPTYEAANENEQPF